MGLGSLPAENAKKLRESFEGQMILGYHPVGLVTFISRKSADLSFPAVERWVIKLNMILISSRRT